MMTVIVILSKSKLILTYNPKLSQKHEILNEVKHIRETYIEVYAYVVAATSAKEHLIDFYCGKLFGIKIQYFIIILNTSSY